MKRLASWSGALALALAVTACGGDNTTDTANTQTGARDNAAVGTAGAGTNNAAAEREFVEEHLAMGEHEIALGQLAQQKGSHPEVKRFGEMMVRDHRSAGEELKQLRTQLGTTGTTGTAGTNNAGEDMREHHRESVEELQKLSGREFDREYIDLMIEDHEKAVNELERISGNGSTELRQWAAKTLPKVQQHLEQARQIKETLDQAGDNNNSNNNNRRR